MESRVRQENTTRRLRLAWAIALIAFACNATSDERSQRADSDAQHTPAQTQDDLLERLEVGMSALEELGYEAELAQLQRVAQQVREGRQDGNEEHAEIREVRRRLVVMRIAVETLVEADRHDAAESVELAMHARELAIERRTDPAAMRIRASAPDRGQLSELLALAAGLQAQQGGAEQARELVTLSAVYAEQWRRRQAGRETRWEEISGGEGLQDLRRRLEVLRDARAAHAEAGRPDAAALIERAIHVGELQLEEAPDEAILAAFEGLDMGMVIELLQSASGLYREWGHPDRAELCNALAEFYARRERERREEH